MWRNKMKRMTIIFLMIFVQNVFSWDEVNNGGGAAEGTLTYTFLNVEKYIDLCLSSEICQISDREKDILSQIKKSLEDEYAQEKPLIFMSENNNPGTFIIDGEIKIAKTGDAVGTPIYFNLDLLYFKNNLGIYESIDIKTAIGIIIHELGHHHNIQDHSFLDALGAKVALGLNKHIQVSSFFSFNDQLQVIVLNEKKENSFPQILLRVYDDLIDISDDFKKELKCNFMALPNLIDILPGISISFKRPKGAVFHNIHWTNNTKIEKLITCTAANPDKCFDNNKDVHVENFYIKGNLSNLCDKDATLFTGNKDYRARIKFSAYAYKNKSNTFKFKFKKNSVKIKQLWEPWWQIISLNLINY